ncbi:Gfo/Idh/MocA family oxidoreductase [Ruficoccus sp. ZRK36]|uniref:Gfo/Idh/MocA family protein n=1 Tax=Ruficoccus sp. ZRK36 TaxID=2866311 RepID=UPI001C72D8FB|nr:Gfo/Idh/MocA family oxidoreductase [Ruficoccus sp. ZRK36]QYY35018.1 Gfo/Idh/MocA family oxidoreductase [Ruficoccus sp. ZRK36]
MSSYKKVWRVGILHDTSKPGLGGHLTHLAFTGLPQVEIVGLVDSNYDGIEARMLEIGAVRHYGSLDALLDDGPIDILVICSRLPGEHSEPLRVAVERGIHVYCEKPLCAGLDEVDHIVEQAEERGVCIAVAHLGRYANVFQTARGMIGNGDIGRVVSFYGRGKEDHRGGGEDMLVLGTHILDLGCYLLGAPRSVFADITFEGKPIKAGQCLETAEPIGPVAGDEVLAMYQFSNSVRGWFESRRGMTERGVRMGITIVGTTGTLAVRFDEERKLRLSRSAFPPEDEACFEDVPLLDETVIPGASPLEFGSYKGHQHYFIRNNRRAAWDLICALKEGREPLASVRDAQVVLEMIYGAYASQLTGSRVSFPLCERRHPLEIVA